MIPSRCRRGGAILLLVLSLGKEEVAAQNAPLSETRSLGTLASLLGIPPSSEPVKCGLTLISEAIAQHDRRSPQVSAALRTLMVRPILQTSILKNGFRVHFDTTGFNTPALLNGAHQPIPGTAVAYAESVAAIASYVARYDSLVLGYDAPPQDGGLGGGPEYDIYIESLSGEYGRTTPDQDIPNGMTSPTYMEVHNDFTFVTPDSNKGLPALRVTVAHEFHHAIQLGSYAYWQSDVYYHEITSVWMEEVLYTGVNDYYQYLKSSWGHFRNPGVSFATSDLIDYSRGIWGLMIEKKFDRAAIRKSWEEARTLRPLEAIDRSLRQAPYSSGMQSAFTDWTLWNYYTGVRSDPARYYIEGAMYPQVAMVPYEFVPTSMTISQSLAPLAARYHQVIVQTGPMTMDTLVLALSNVDLQSAGTDPSQQIPYRLVLSTVREDPTFRPAGLGLYVKLDVSNPLLWTTWFIGDSSASLNLGFLALAEGTPFPSPFTPDGKVQVSIPINASNPVYGILSVYTGNMDLVYTSGSVPSSGSARQLFSWNGLTERGTLVSSGVYLYVLKLDDGRMLRGKIAVLRR